MPSVEREIRCLDDNQVVDYLLGLLDDATEREVEGHLDACPGCRALIVQTVRAAPGDPTLSGAALDGEEERYLLREERGLGGQSRVLFAWDTRLGREVAIKELRPAEGMSAQDRARRAERFLIEARIAGRLNHPTIVDVYELGDQDDGTPYYTMPWLGGRTLGDAIGEADGIAGRLELLGHFVDLCNGVAYAHTRSVLHRDLKPQNIMIGEFGETLILDWGLAKVRGEPWRGGHPAPARAPSGELPAPPRSHDDPQMTAEGVVVGTPAYMSPEQARGEHDNVDARSDVWSLGAILFEILTGRPPFAGRDHDAVIEQVTDAPMPRVRDFIAPAPPELAAIAEKALSRDRGERYTGAKQLATEINDYLHGRRVSAYTYSTWELLRHFAARRRSTLAGVGAVAAVLVAAVIVLSISFGRERASRRRESDARKREQTERLMADYRLALLYGDRARRLLADRKLLSAPVFAAASLLYNPVNPSSPRYAAWLRKRLPAGERVRVDAVSVLYQSRMESIAGLRHVVATGTDLTCAAYNRRGRLAAGASDGTLLLWPDPGASPPRRIERAHGKQIFAVAWSPYGERLASAGRDGLIHVWHDRPLKRLRTLRGHRQGIWSLAFLPDGRLASAGWDGTARVWDVEAGRESRRLKHATGLFGLAVAPDGRTLATGGRSGVVTLWDLQTGKVRLTLRGHRKRVFALAFSPDGRRLASAGGDLVIRLWDSATGQLQLVLHGHTDMVLGLGFVRDGDQTLLVSAAQDRTLRFWDIESGDLRLALEGHQEGIVGLAHHQLGDQGRLASVAHDGTLRIWETGSSPAALLLRGHKESVYNLRFAPRGDLLASVGLEGMVRLWNGRTGRAVRTLRAERDLLAVAFSPDARLVAAAGSGRTIHLWEVASGKRLRRLRGHRDLIAALEFSPDGRYLASASADGSVRLWPIDAGKPPRILTGHRGAVRDLAFVSRRQLLSSGEDRAVIVWDVRTGRASQRLRGHGSWATAVAAAPSQRWALSADKVGQVVLWDLRRKRARRKWRAHRRWINRVSWSRDGRHIATAGDDRQVSLWSAPAGRPVLRIRTRTMVSGIDFNHASSRLAIADGRTIRIYPLLNAVDLRSPAAILERAKRAAGIRIER